MGSTPIVFVRQCHPFHPIDDPIVQTQKEQRERSKAEVEMQQLPEEVHSVPHQGDLLPVLFPPPATTPVSALRGRLMQTHFLICHSF